MEIIPTHTFNVVLSDDEASALYNALENTSQALDDEGMELDEKLIEFMKLLERRWAP